MPPKSRAPLIAAAVAAVALAVFAARYGARLAILSGIGLALGITLYGTAFGFTGAYRDFFVREDASGVKAQLVMLALATVLFAPMLSHGTVLGQPLAGAVAPAGVSVAVGAFLFGIGMQLAGGCGSGTLYALGGGSPRMLVTLGAFCAGSFWASLHMAFWQALPAYYGPALGESIGWPTAAGIQLAVFGAAYLLLPGTRPGRRLLAGAIALALLNALTLATSGHPWSITWAFALWGAKIARFAGWNPNGDPFWSADFQRVALESSVLADETSVMDFAIVIGAFAAASLAGRLFTAARASLASFAAAVIGGLAMGYGARIAYGCNVGAFFSGVASTSLHGWLWIVAALPGNWIGVRLRPLFRLP